jgi:hypothetical protein
MSDVLAVPGDGASGPAASPGCLAAITHLDPAAPFPAELGKLSLVELHVLHSRVCRQLDLEYLTDPAGPHPLTLDRHSDLVAELDTRESLEAPPGGIVARHDGGSANA